MLFSQLGAKIDGNVTPEIVAIYISKKIKEKFI